MDRIKYIENLKYINLLSGICVYELWCIFATKKELWEYPACRVQSFKSHMVGRRNRNVCKM